MVNAVGAENLGTGRLQLEGGGGGGGGLPRRKLGMGMSYFSQQSEFLFSSIIQVQLENKLFTHKFNLWYRCTNDLTV